MLNIFTLAYQGAAPAGLPTEGTREVQQRQVFATYIERMLARRRISKHISRENTLRWLTFLAARMQQHHQTMFSLEQIQPDWLEEPRSRSLYRLSAWLVLSPLLVLLGLTFLLLMRHIVISLIVVIAFSLVTMPFNALLGRQLIGNNQLFDTLEGELTQIQPREAFRWSRKEISPMINSRRSVWSAMVPAILGSVTGSVGILVVLVITHPRAPITSLLPILLALLFGSLIFGASFVLPKYGEEPLRKLVGSLSTNHLGEETRRTPNQGIWSSARSGLVVGLPTGLLMGLATGLPAGLFGGLPVGLDTGLFFGLFAGLGFGLDAFVLHFLLRFWLWRINILPWKIVPFLDECDFAAYCGKNERYILHKESGTIYFTRGI